MVNTNTIFAKDKPLINKQDLLLSLGRISSIRCDTMGYLKGGAMKGSKSGTVTIASLEQYQSAEALLSSVVGNDVGVLEPGHYSKEDLSNSNDKYSRMQLNGHY